MRKRRGVLSRARTQPDHIDVVVHEAPVKQPQELHIRVVMDPEPKESAPDLSNPPPFAFQEGQRPLHGARTSRLLAGRLHVKYVGLPTELWEKLKAWADRNEGSISWAARKAVREFLERQGGD